MLHLILQKVNQIFLEVSNEKILQGKAYKVVVANQRTLSESTKIDGIDLKYEPDLSFEETATLRTTNLKAYQLSWKILPKSSLSLYEGSQRWALQHLFHFKNVNSESLTSIKFK